jgi:carbamoyltransferase
LRKLLEFDKSNPLVWHRVGDCPETYFSYDYLKKLLELKRFDVVCAGLQRFAEDMLTTWVANCIAKTGIRKLALGGGVFMNVKVNQAIMNLPEVDDVYIYPSCGDETNAMGAAYHIYAENADPRSIVPLDGLYLGREFDDDAILKTLKKTNEFEWEYVEDIEAETARLLTEGQVVARFKGRDEFGARALGNRSIVGDPCRDGVIREINDMIKSRDFWMPFAPSMIPSAAEKYLVNEKKVDAPYMIMAFDTTDLRTDMPAALHPYDSTARPQVVKKETNPDYYRLIEEFEKRTGRGVILNTSFNLHGYPIVGTGLRNLTLGNYLVRKS